jgi:hypothetical protein
MGVFNAFHYGLVFYIPLKENIDTHERGRQNNNGSYVFDAPLTLYLYATFAHPFHNAQGRDWGGRRGNVYRARAAVPVPLPNAHFPLELEEMEVNLPSF